MIVNKIKPDPVSLHLSTNIHSIATTFMRSNPNEKQKKRATQIKLTCKLILLRTLIKIVSAYM